MKRFRVSVAIRILEIYEVEAENADEARDAWGIGDLIHTDDEALETEILKVEAI